MDGGKEYNRSIAEQKLKAFSIGSMGKVGRSKKDQEVKIFFLVFSFCFNFPDLRPISNDLKQTSVKLTPCEFLPHRIIPKKDKPYQLYKEF